ncbi:MAG: tetratricopeptide repeat protein, partial [Bryobacteraceae bacterium]
ELRSYDYYLGVIALDKGRSDEAIAHFKEALAHLPPSSGLNLYEDCLGNAYLALGQTDGALKEYRRILAFNPNYPLLHYHMAQAFERKGEQQLARDEYSRFLDLWKQADSDIPEVIDARRKLDQSDPALHAAAKHPG